MFLRQEARPHFEVLKVSHIVNSAHKVDSCKQIVNMLPQALKMGCKNPDFFHIGEECFSKGVYFRLFYGY